MARVDTKENAYLGGSDRLMRGFGSSRYYSLDEDDGVLPWAQELTFPQRKGEAGEERQGEIIGGIEQGVAKIYTGRRVGDFGVGTSGCQWRTEGSCC